MSILSEVSIYNANACVNNWKRWRNFGIYDPDEHEGRFIFYTSNRDSGLLDLSNEKAISEALDPFMSCQDDSRADVISFGANHWAVGYVDGFSVKVFQPDGKTLTEAFQEVCRLSQQLEDYPVLDEEHYSEIEYQATLDNIENEGSRLFEGDAPECWASEVFSWLWDNNQGAVEDEDDHGGYPNEEEIKEALVALGMIVEDSMEENE
jgi:hypothetical protein